MGDVLGDVLGGGSLATVAGGACAALATVAVVVVVVVVVIPRLSWVTLSHAARHGTNFHLCATRNGLLTPVRT